MRLTVKQLTGRDDSALLAMVGEHRLLPEVASAFAALQSEASVAGFDLRITSSYRSYDRQLAIFNGKASGQRPIHDDQGQLIDIAVLSPREKLESILRYSALPGASRHHWGTDLDVYDAAAVPADYRVQLTPQEVAPGGVFDAFHCWLDERIAARQSHGFFRPYGEDRGGVAPERWHLSYAPIASTCDTALTVDLLRQCWDCEAELALRDVIEGDLEAIFKRFVAVVPGWCPLP